MLVLTRFRESLSKDPAPEYIPLRPERSVEGCNFQAEQNVRGWNASTRNFVLQIPEALLDGVSLANTGDKRV
jgi:hypothetical protein